MFNDSFQVLGDILKFGNWQVDLRSDEFAEIKFRGHRVLRSIRCVVRDRDWNTADLTVCRKLISENEVQIEIRSEGYGSSFSGTLKARFEDEAAFFELSLIGQEDFESNRTGLVVLHGTEVSGLNLEVLHSSGDIESTTFPVEISPHQPVMDIEKLTWNKSKDFQISLNFAGDVFEMEDQRNWTDASFKTYSRPLSLPFPYLVKGGERIWQAITIQASQVTEFVAPNEKLIIELLQKGSAPALQINASTAPGVPPKSNNFAAAELVEIDLQTINWPAALKRSQESMLPLDLRVVFSDDYLTELKELIKKIDPRRVLRIGLFDPNIHVSTEQNDNLLRALLGSDNVHIPIVSGTRAHFTEFNRNQESILQSASELTFSSTPLFHSLSGAQLIEALPIQRLTALQAVRIAAGRPLHIGPVCLRPRFNNVATAQAPMPTRGDLSEGYGAELQGHNDKRQQSRELAAWTIASAIAFSVPGVSSISWFESWGPRGITDANGHDYPVAHALKEISRFSGSTIYLGQDHKLEIWVMASRMSDGRLDVLASNMSSHNSNFQIKIEGEEHQIELDSFSWGKYSFASK